MQIQRPSEHQPVLTPAQKLNLGSVYQIYSADTEKLAAPDFYVCVQVIDHEEYSHKVLVNLETGRAWSTIDDPLTRWLYREVVAKVTLSYE